MSDDIDYDKLPDTSNALYAHRMRPLMRETREPVFKWLAATSGVSTVAGLAASLVAPPLGAAMIAAGLATAALNVKKGEVKSVRSSLANVSWEEIARGLANSPDPLEREHVYLGWLRDDPTFPILAPIYSLMRHAAISGTTAGGKTSRAAIPIALQLIMRGYSVIPLNNKGTDENIADVEILRREAARMGASFRYLTLNGTRASFVWDPFENETRSMFSPRQYVSLLANAFGIEHGDGHGEAFWSAVNKMPLLKGMRGYPGFVGFRLLERMLEDPAERKRMGLTKRDVQYASHLRAIISSASTIDVMNPDPNSPEHQYRISLLEPFQRPTVLYFDLFSSVDGDATKLISRLVIRMLTAIARVYQGPKVPVFVVYDEAQESMNRSLLTPIKQARDSGVHFIFTYQDASDLKNADVDLTGNMATNTAVKIQFSAQDGPTRDEIISTSGEREVEVEGTSETVSDGPNGTTISYSRQIGKRYVPRTTQDDINDINRSDGDAFLHIVPNYGFSQLKRRVAIYAPHPTGPAELAELRAARWPDVMPGITIRAVDTVPFEVPVEPEPAPLPPSPEPVVEAPKPKRKRGERFAPTPEQKAAADELAARMRAHLNDTFKPKGSQ